MTSARLLVLLLAATACRTAPIAAVPEPLPEVLAWESGNGNGAFVGLHVEENDSGALDALFFDPGVRVTHVVENSPAAGTGVHVGDVVLAVGGEEIDDPGAFDALLQAAGAGAEVALSVRRGDTVFDVPVVLQAATSAETSVLPAWLADPSRSGAGWATAPGGVRLVAAHEDSPFPAAGIPVSSLVVELDGRPVRSDRELIRRLQTHEPGDTVGVRVAADDGRLLDSRVRLVSSPMRVTELHLLVLLDYTASVDGQETRLSLLDLWIFELFKYERDGNERRWVLFEIFGFEVLGFAAGVGELDG